ncbi:HNH endonuclease [Streptomyces sp. NPDC058657]|uniref:HNH endonuclease n=1 Tax=unclassified Streptomyces TaxID=2593676 RepID=UPI003668B6DD
MADTAIEWTERTPARRFRASAATRIGVSLAEYDTKLAAGLKWCTGCKEWHTRQAFAKDRTRWDGLKAACTARTPRKRPGPTIPERRRRAALGQAWCSVCQLWLTTSEVRGGICKPHAAAAARDAYRGHAGEQIRARVYARARGLDPIPPWWRTQQFGSFDGLCAYACNRPATSIDHVWPVARGGRSVPGNLAPACTSCNSSKGDRHPAPWVERGITSHPHAWEQLIALALEHNTDEWLEEINDG